MDDLDLTKQSQMFVPFLLQATAPETLQAFFDGPVSEVGDHVVLVCYKKTDKHISLKFKVIGKNF